VRRTPAQEAYLARLGKDDPDLADAYALTQDFATMLRGRQGGQMGAWLVSAKARSSDPVEGQITRLKLLKRHGYGRAGFALLRQRVLRPVGRRMAWPPRRYTCGDTLRAARLSMCSEVRHVLSSSVFQL